MSPDPKYNPPVPGRNRLRSASGWWLAPIRVRHTDHGVIVRRCGAGLERFEDRLAVAQSGPQPVAASTRTSLMPGPEHGTASAGLLCERDLA